MIPREDFIDWLNHPTTKLIQKELEEQVKDARVEMSRQVGTLGVERLRYLAGKIDGIEETILFKELFAFTKPIEEDDETEGSGT